MLVAALLGAATGRDAGSPDAGLPILLPTQDGGQDSGAHRDSGAAAESPAPKVADPRAWMAVCGVKCFCADNVSPRICLCSQPSPRDGSMYVFTPSVNIYAADGGVLQAPLVP